MVNRSNSAFEPFFDAVKAYLSIIVRQQGVALPAQRIVAEGLFLLQVAGEVGRGLPPQRDGGFKLALVLGCALHQVAQAGVFEVDKVALRLQVGTFADAAAGIDAGELFLAQDFAEAVTAQLKAWVGVFKTGAQKGGVAGAVGQMFDVAVEQQQVGFVVSLGAMAADAPGELDDRAHRRGFNNGPVVVVIPAHFSNGGGEYDENLIWIRVGVDLLAQFGVFEQRGGVVALEQAIQPLLNGRAHQQRVVRVIDAEVDALPGRCPLSDQIAGDQGQRVDVGEADQAEADALAAARVGLVVAVMQAGDGGWQGLCQIGTNLFAAGAGDGQRQDFCLAPLRGLVEAGQALFDKGGMGAAVAADGVVIRGFGSEFVKPGAADLGRSLRLTAVLGKFCPPSAVGLEQAFDQRGRQGGG